MRHARCALLLLLASCSSATGPEQVRVFGSIISSDPGDPHIELAVQGHSVTVRVTTHGNGCYSVASTATTATTATATEATVTPWDYTTGPGAHVNCADLLRPLTHEVALQFGATGTARILVRGLDTSEALGGKSAKEVTVERVVELP